MSVRKTPLEQALELGFRHGRVPEALGRLGDYPLRNVRDVRSLVDALERLDRLPPDEQPEAIAALCQLMHVVVDAEAYHVLETELLPALAKQFVATRRRETSDASGLLLALKVMAMYDWDPALRLMADAAREGFENNSLWWSAIFAALPPGSTMAERLCRTFFGALPVGHIAVALLDLANNLASDHRLKEHPFDTQEGYRQLERWLRHSDETHLAHAISAAEALHHLDPVARNNLMALALDHPEPRVQLEAAWASARGGSEAARKVLARFCLDMHTAHAATTCLRGMGRGNEIPPEAFKPDFQALAEASDFLQQPHIHSHRPTTLEVMDHREMVWPPAGQSRPLWLLRFEDKMFPSGVVLIGSTTPRMLRDADPTWPAEDLYALYCSAEAAAGDDESLHPDGAHSLEHGRSLLAKYNST